MRRVAGLVDLPLSDQGTPKMTPSLELHGRRALVMTGGCPSTDPICEILAAGGASVAVHDNDLVAAFDRVEALARDGVEAVPVNFDATDPAEVTSTLDRLGPIDICVSCITVGAVDGASPASDFRHTDPAVWSATLMGGVLPVALAWRALLPGMLAQRWGRLVALMPGPIDGQAGSSASSAAGAAVAALAGSIAQEATGRQVTANCITVPGPNRVTSGRCRGSASDHAARTDVDASSRAADAAALVAYLVAPSGSLLSGQTIPLAGSLITTD